MKSFLYLLHYPTHQVPIQAKNITVMLSKVMREVATSEVDPDWIELPDGNIMIWNAFITEAFYFKKQLTEEDYMELTVVGGVL